MQRGLGRLLARNDEAVYVVALKCMVLAAAGGMKATAPRSPRPPQWLTAAQLDTGMWTYTQGGQAGRGDNSNTQFALLGLHEAAKAGRARARRRSGGRSHDHFANTQLGDGGWTYVFNRTGSNQSYGSMTAAGVASLFITGDQLHVAPRARLRQRRRPRLRPVRRRTARSSAG